MQTNLLTDQQHDPQTGEVRDTISTRAMANVQPRRQWDRLEGLVIRSAAEQEQSQYELAFLEAQNKIVSVLEADAKAEVDTRSGGKFKYSYATLGQLLSHVRPILHACGFTLKQGTGRIHKMGLDSGNMLYLPVYTKLTYVGSGESETFVIEMPLPKMDPQAIGSATSYGRRYCLLSALGIAVADDDGMASMSQRTLSRDDEKEAVAGIIEQIRASGTIADLKKCGAATKNIVSGMSQESRDKCADAYMDRLAHLQEDKPEEQTQKGKGK